MDVQDGSNDAVTLATATAGAVDPTALMTRAELLPLILQQLNEYGFGAVATVIAKQTGTQMTAESSSRLAHLCQLGKSVLGVSNTAAYSISSATLKLASGSGVSIDGGVSEAGINAGLAGSTVSMVESIGSAINSSTMGLDYGRDAVHGTKMGQYSCQYTARTSVPVTSVAYSNDGQYVAYGLENATIKVLDVNCALTGRPPPRKLPGQSGGKAANDRFNSALIDPNPCVIRTITDHAKRVSNVKFHPNGAVLATASPDQSVRLFDLTKPTTRRAFKFFLDSHPVNAIEFSPSGDHLAVATDDSLIRIIDVHSNNMFTPHKQSYGTGGLFDVKWSPNGALIVTAGTDGHVRIWDVVSGKCLLTLNDAHGVNNPVHSAQFASNNKFVLTSGGDSIVKLWDISGGQNGKVIRNFRGANMQRDRDAKAIFVGEGDLLVAAPDTVKQNIVTWDSRSGAMLHSTESSPAHIGGIAASPIDSSFATGSADGAVRLWYPSDGIDGSGSTSQTTNTRF
ncbi:WD40 repeat-like protein [Ramicandelaber brevisporus]|nr:WD40 repeat-like protein [Ramicandelaber brevisporus]